MANGEFDLIAKLVRRLPPPGPRLRVASGDDAAVAEPGGLASATTIDTIVEGVHFELPAFPLRAVGRKAIAAALSDLAAMGADPGEAYVSLGAPPSLTADDLMEVGEGLAEVAGREGVSVAGGDVTRAPVLTLTVACVGYERPGTTLLTRSGAREGDVLAVTGELGGAAGALIALGLADPPEGTEASDLPADHRDPLLARQFDPRPRFAAARALLAAGASALIDISDGLGADAGHIAEMSGVGIEIDVDAIPVARELEALVGPATARRLAAAGGEDFELLATIPPDAVGAAGRGVGSAGARLSVVGQVTAGGGVVMEGSAGRIEPTGFDHMRGSGSD